jgi:membrane protease YdiL (CAAX protease family)
MVIGVYLGALYVWFGNLTVPVVVHGTYDFIALVYAVKIRGRG